MHQSFFHRYMETARKRSSCRRYLGFEAKPGKKKKSVKLPEEKKLYVFIWHSYCAEPAYSLYALDIPTPGTTVTAKPTTTTTTTTTVNGVLTGTTTTVSRPEPAERSHVEPVLRFDSDEWPCTMTCIGLNSKMYFLGGRWKAEERSLPNEVHILDLSSKKEIPSSFRDRPKDVLIPGPSMKTGKCDPFVCFVADDKIFVVCGTKQCPATGKDLTQFEVFDPAVNEWQAPRNVPPFQDASHLFCPLIVGRNVLFLGLNEDLNEDLSGFTCCYNLDSGTWSEKCPPGIGYNHKNFKLVMDSHIYNKFALRVESEAIGETLWNVCRYPITNGPGPVAVRLDISNNKKDKKKEKKYFDVVKYYIESTVGECAVKGVSSILTRLGSAGDGPSLSVRLCYLEVAFPDEEYDLENCHMGVTLFDVHDNGDRAEYLTSAHYVAQVNGIPLCPVAAYAV